MAHKNYGGVNHSNTGYNNHTNSYNNHTNYYSNHTNKYSNHTNTYSQLADTYGNYTQRHTVTVDVEYYSDYYDSGSGYGDFRTDIDEELFRIELLEPEYLFIDDSPTTFYNQTVADKYDNKSSHADAYANIGGPGYKNHVDHDGGSTYTEKYWKNYLNHTQAYHVQSSYSQGGYNNGGGSGYKQTVNTGYRQGGTAGYNQGGYANMNGSQYAQYSQSGYTNHTNSGYTNHVNTTTNVPPTNVSNVNRGASAYYKSTISLTWTGATDNNKVISVVSRNTGSGSHADNGIWENTVRKQAAVRSWAAAYWNANGSFGGSTSADVYGNAAAATTFVNWLKSADSVANRTIAVLGYDEPYNNASAIINLLKSWGYSSLNNADSSHFVFTGISTSKVAVRSQQTVRRYGTSDVRVASSSYTIPGVSSSQAITYHIDYCFRPIGGSYGSWTRIVNGLSATSYNYSLASHGNGHIKFRVLSSDGVETGSSWIESSEVRVLKYDAPAGWVTTSTGTGIAGSDAEMVKVEINKLCSATGNTQTTVGTAPGQTITKTHINDFRNKLKAVGTSISKGNIGDTNVDKIYAADVQNIKNWIKGV